ncbi:MAG: AmmeMemoRadiSam system protein B [Acidobacteria bacterium]|jgi:AmmeMemoRadiSam system protein B|nr:AmmeMemoRadiSam system protein B [Acidobacteriota bacterium]
MKPLTFLASLCFVFSLGAQDVRAVRDDIGFCWHPAQMQRLLDLLAGTVAADMPAPGLVAGISPHDDYLYAGSVYYPLFMDLRTREAVIFGVTHGSVRKEIGDPRGVLILDGFRSWNGLGAPVGISPLREHLKRSLEKGDFIVSDRAHSLEHSIEALLPWLQHFNPGIRITPIMVTAMPFARMEELSSRLAAAMAAYIRAHKLQLGRDIVFLISADANHYGRDFANIPFGEDENAHAQGIEQDRRIAQAAIAGVLDDEKVLGLTRELWGATYLDYRNTYWCGKYDIPFGLLAVRKAVLLATGKRLSGKLFRYSDTYSEGVLPLKKAGFGITAPYSLKHWVGFFSAGFFLE